MNPILPRQYFTPDVEARQWPDGRIYLYGSNDICGDSMYCSHEYRVFSSGDLLHWTDHGVSFDGYGHSAHTAVEPGVLYAPDCVRIGEQYCLLYCQSGNQEGIAFSDRPEGPFSSARHLDGAHNSQIDPAAFVDDDGAVYYYWGQVSAKGGRLNAGLTGIEPDSVMEGILNESEHGFHEGISIRKHNGLYYLVYTDISRGRATCLGYATSEWPLGPYKKRGILIDNMGCDPESWNNHGSIEKINGRWYVFYHRSTRNSRFSRRVCVEPIQIAADGSIREVEMTTQGVDGPLDTFQPQDAASACLLHGRVYIDSLNAANEQYEFLNQVHHGNWAAYKYYMFSGMERLIRVEAASMSEGGQVRVCLDTPDGECVACITTSRTGGWNAFETFEGLLSTPITGQHALYFIFSGGEGRLMSVRSFVFEK